MTQKLKKFIAILTLCFAFASVVPYTMYCGADVKTADEEDAGKIDGTGTPTTSDDLVGIVNGALGTAQGKIVAVAIAGASLSLTISLFLLLFARNEKKIGGLLYGCGITLAACVGILLVNSKTLFALIEEIMGMNFGS